MPVMRTYSGVPFSATPSLNTTTMSKDLDDLKAHLSNDRISYGCFKVLGVDTRGAVVATRTKYIAFTWQGPNVSKLKVAKAIAHK